MGWVEDKAKEKLVKMINERKSKHKIRELVKELDIEAISDLRNILENEALKRMEHEF